VAGSPAARPSSAGLLGGLNIAGLDYGSTTGELARALAWARALHAKVVRVDIPWSVMEPQGAGRIDPHALAFADRLVSDAEAAGIKVIMMVESTPCWDSSAPTSLLSRCSTQRMSQANAWPPTNDADYAAFVAYLAQRYGPNLAAMEIWNEPDQANQLYLAGPNKPQQYAAILRAAYPAIKQVDPTLPVLGGSLVGSNGAFLRALYKAGIKGYYDGLSVHFYNLTLASLRSIHEVQLENGDDTPLWLNEFGFSSCWPGHKIQQEQACVTKQLQATDLASIVRSLARVPYVASAMVYELQGSPTEEFGVVTAGGSHKPSFSALASALASPSTGSAGTVTLSLRRAGTRVLASGSGPPGDFMRLEVLGGGVLRYWAFFTLDRFNHYSIHLPSALGTSGLTARVYQYWEGSAKAVQSGI
jgi:endo-1,4-beta-mannosidase